MAVCIVQHSTNKNHRLQPNAFLVQQERKDQTVLTALVTTLPSLLLIRSHLPLIPPYPILPLSPRHPPHRAALRSSILLLLPILLINLHQPIIIILVLPLVPPSGHPLALLLIVHQLLAPLLIRKRSAGLRVVLADALLACEQLPFRGWFGRGQGLVPGERGGGRWEGEQHALLRGGGDGAGGYELVEEGLHAVAGGGFEGGVEGLVAGEFEGVWVVGEQVAQVEGVGGWLGDGDGAFRRCISSGFWFL